MTTKIIFAQVVGSKKKKTSEVGCYTVYLVLMSRTTLSKIQNLNRQILKCREQKRTEMLKSTFEFRMQIKLHGTQFFLTNLYIC